MQLNIAQPKKIVNISKYASKKLTMQGGCFIKPPLIFLFYNKHNYTYMAQELNDEINHNMLSVDEIKDYQNSDILEMLMEAGVAHEGDDITESDLEATKARAIFLAKENTLPVETLFVKGYIDRKESLGHAMDADLRNLSYEMINELVSIELREKGEYFSETDIELWRKSNLPIIQWAKERILVKNELGKINTYFAIDEKSGMVIGSDETQPGALRDGLNAINEGGLEKKSTD